MKKKPKIKGGRNQFTILRDPSYWRLRAEIEAIKVHLETAFILSIAASVGMRLDPESEEYKKDAIQFQKRFKKVVDVHHRRFLEALENLSPELSAQLDNRESDEIDTH
jgi:hypothetical protein